jgi:hypothetical protein
MTCDERFIALAQELNYDIYGENTAGVYYAPLIRHRDELYIKRHGAAGQWQDSVSRSRGVGVDAQGCPGCREHQRCAAWH